MRWIEKLRPGLGNLRIDATCGRNAKLSAWPVVRDLEGSLTQFENASMAVGQMASKDELRPFREWYDDAVEAVAKAMHDGEDAGQLIRDRVEALDEAEARDVLQVIIATTAQEIVQRESEAVPQSQG